MGIRILLNNIALYAIYSAVIYIFFLSIFGKIKYGLIFLIFLLPLQNVFAKLQELPFGKDIPNLILLAMTLGWLIIKNSQHKPIFEKTSFNFLLVSYALYAYFTLWNGTFNFHLPAPLDISEPRLQTWKNYMVLPLLFFIVFNNTKEKKELVRLFVFMCLTIILMNRSTLFEIGNATSWVSRSKFHGTFQWLGANEVAAFYATYTFVLFGVFLYLKKWGWKLLLAILIAINLYCDLFLFSRGAYLATLAGFSLIGIYRNRIILVIVAIILLFWQVILPQEVIERINFTEQEGQLDQSAEKRIEYWQETMEYFKQSPLVGVGFNIKTYVGSQRDTHNLYIRTLAEEGIIGLGFLLTIMFLALKRGLQLFKKAQDRFLKGLGLGFAACTLAAIAGNCFGDRWTYLPLGTYFWIFLAMVERGNAIVLEEKIKLNKKVRIKF